MFKNHKIIPYCFLTAAVCMSCLLADASTRSEYWQQRVSLFDALPVTQSDIVFLGNSITDGGEFAEIFGDVNIKNRGISGDVISGVAERTAQITSGHPSKIFLLIGINDISHGKSAQELADEYDSLVKQILIDSPETQLYLQSVMPVNNDFSRYKKLQGKENVISELNLMIENIADKYGIIFIDLTETMADPSSGKLREEFTNDGLHLLAPGYIQWTRLLKPYIYDSL